MQSYSFEGLSAGRGTDAEAGVEGASATTFEVCTAGVRLADIAQCSCSAALLRLLGSSHVAACMPVLRRPEHLSCWHVRHRCL